MEPSDLSLLATLDALLQESSVSGAARRVGLSTPAMSHALARIRDRLSNPILVRAGRGMVLTPRAEALKPRIHTLVSEARQALEAERPLVPSELSRLHARPQRRSHPRQGSAQRAGALCLELVR